MDHTLNNIMFKTSMETFLKCKLREQEELNFELKELIAKGITISADDALKFIKLRDGVKKLVKYDLANMEKQRTLEDLANLVRE